MIKHPEFSLVDRVKLEKMSWEAFEQKLVQMLLWLEVNQFLCVQAKAPSMAYIQIGITEGSLRAETASNRIRKGEHVLTEPQMAALLDLGWRPPADGPTGSPNYYRDFPWPVMAADIARLTVRTLSEVLDVPAPSELGFKSGSWDGSPPIIDVLIATFDTFASAKVEWPTGDPQPYQRGSEMN